MRVLKPPPNIVASVIADLRATPTATSVQYGIIFGAAKTLYFDGAGQFTDLVEEQIRRYCERERERFGRQAHRPKIRRH